jgi:hypothetical protein
MKSLTRKPMTIAQINLLEANRTAYHRAVYHRAEDLTLREFDATLLNALMAVATREQFAEALDFAHANATPTTEEK